MAGVDRKSKPRDNKSFDKKSNKSFDKKSDKPAEKQVKFNKTDEKNPFHARNDKLQEAILALGGTKGDLKYLEDVDNEETENLVTGADEKAEVR